MTRGVHVLVAILDDTNRPLQLPGRDRGSSGKRKCPRFLSSEPAANALRARDNLVRREAERFGDNHLVVHRALHRKVSAMFSWQARSRELSTPRSFVDDLVRVE